MGIESAVEIGRLFRPIQAIANALTASRKDLFVRLPGLVGYWPMGMRAAGNVIEHSGSGFNLSQTGTCPTGYDGNSFTHLGDGTNYVWNSSVQLGLTGLETWIDSALRGLTIGGWFAIDDFPSNQGGLITKFGAITEYGYALYVNAAEDVTFSVSSNGSALFQVVSQVVGLGQWYFLVGRYTPATEIAVFANGVKTANTTAIPVSINASAQNLEVGRYLAQDSRIQHARARDVFICAAALSDELIDEIRLASVP